LKNAITYYNADVAAVNSKIVGLVPGCKVINRRPPLVSEKLNAPRVDDVTICGDFSAKMLRLNSGLSNFK
jgi:hypothetical protein